MLMYRAHRIDGRPTIEEKTQTDDNAFHGRALAQLRLRALQTCLKEQLHNATISDLRDDVTTIRFHTYYRIEG
jgi:hypothetical protein